MGNSQRKSSALQSDTEEEIQEATPLQRWLDSEQSHQDLIIFLQKSDSLSQWSSKIINYLKTINNRQKYQRYIVTLLDHLERKIPQNQAKRAETQELYTYFSQRLKSSFYVYGEFYESMLDLTRQSKQQLLFLYQYYSLNEELFDKALYFNYPRVFVEFKSFIKDIIQNQIIVQNEQHFSRFIVPTNKIEEIKHFFETSIKFYVPSQRNKMLQELKLIKNMKEVYIDAIDEILKYDYADICSSMFRNLIAKGYQLTDVQYQFSLKIQLYCLFLYHLSKISLTFNEIKKLSILQIFHYFFTTFDLGETPELVKCFDIYTDPQIKWNQYILNYLFSQQSHITVLIRLIEHKYLTFSGKMDEFQNIINKIQHSKCQIGKYSEYLSTLSNYFDLDFHSKNRYLKLIKFIEVMATFGINYNVDILHNIIYKNWNSLSNEEVNNINQSGLTILKEIIVNYFKQFQLKMKTIVIEAESFRFSTIFQMLKFVQYFKKYFLNDFINNEISHQIFFRELIEHERYIEIKALLSEQKIEQFSINYETIQMVVMDHIIFLVTNKNIKKEEDNIKLLLNIVKLWPASSSSFHYILSYYYYFKYLEEKGINLPAELKQNISIQHFYYVTNENTNKIESIDFNLLFTHHSCIKLQYTNSQTNFIPIITDQFLKFKIYLSNKAFSVKKHKFGNQIIEEIIKYEPPWLSNQLTKILKENSICQQNFLNVAFNFCTKGEDLKFILNLYQKGKIKQKGNKISLKNIKKIGNTFLSGDKYLILTNQLIINEVQYKNLVAEMTFNQNEQLKSNHFLFFNLLSIDSERSFNYAINYNMPPNFIVSFILEGIKKDILHLTNFIPHLLKFLYFAAKKTAGKVTYIKLKQYNEIKVQHILDKGLSQLKIRAAIEPYILTNFERMVKNYKINQVVTQQFMSLYIISNTMFRFLYQQAYRKNILVELREQPMSKPNSKVLKQLSELVGIDILELSLYNLISKVNSNQELDDQCWTIVQKLIFWGDQKKTAYYIIQKLSQKVQVLDIFISIAEYLRESQPIYKEIVTEQHLEIIKSLAAVEEDKNLYGFIPENYFQKSVGVYPSKKPGFLSQNHRKILKSSGSTENIFVLSKVLYFMYGCNEQIEKIVLGEFSLQQQDSQEFQNLRKKVKQNY